MKFKTLTMTTAALLLTANVGWTADDTEGDNAESTIRLMGVAEAMLPNAVTKEIALPAALMEDSVAVENAAEGLETVNENRQRRESGLTQADEARERGSEMADEAKDNRQNSGRSEDRPEPPPNPGPPSN
jgi:hypothetical protein